MCTLVTVFSPLDLTSLLLECLQRHELTVAQLQPQCPSHLPSLQGCTFLLTMESIFPLIGQQPQEHEAGAGAQLGLGREDAGMVLASWPESQAVFNLLPP